MTETDTENPDLSVRNAESICPTLKNIVSEVAGGVSSSDFQDILTTLKQKPATAKHLYDMQTADIIRDIHEVIDKMYSEAKIDNRYNEITQLINDSTTEKDFKAWRPTTGDCDLQLEATRKKSLTETKNELEILIQEERSKRVQLKRSLNHRRDHIRSLLKNIEAAKTKLHRISENYNE